MSRSCPFSWQLPSNISTVHRGHLLPHTQFCFVLIAPRTVHFVHLLFLFHVPILTLHFRCRYWLGSSTCTFYLAPARYLISSAPAIAATICLGYFLRIPLQTHCTTCTGFSLTSPFRVLGTELCLSGCFKCSSLLACKAPRVQLSIGFPISLSRIHLTASLYMFPPDCFQDILLEQAGNSHWKKLAFLQHIK